MTDHLVLCVSGRARRLPDHRHAVSVRTRNLTTNAFERFDVGGVTDATFAGERFLAAFDDDEPIEMTVRTCACGEGELYAPGPGGNVLDHLADCS